MVVTMSETNNVDKFKNFLKEIFRINLQDLDFGIYKIMKMKQDIILKFIDDDLVHIVDLVISGFPNKEQNMMTDVFNLSYEFLSRYYSDGDFIPKIRYGGRDKYMIPYKGQEVELYWATRNSYFVKTTEYFTNYSFIVSNPLIPDTRYKVNFKIKDADLNKNFVASENKYFFIAEDPIIVHGDEVDIFFNYRPIRDDGNEVFLGNEKTVRDTIKQKAEESVLNNAPKHLREILSGKTKENETERSIIRRHIDIYFRKNESDYFIVKNLKAFLNSELDNFVKNEILILDAEFKVPEKKALLAKTVSSLCKQIIEQISQIEDFERRLWVKKKFVYNVNYVITLDKIAHTVNGIDTIRKLLNHKGMGNQIEEWANLGIIGSDFNTKRLLENGLDGQILNEEYKFLTIDTKHFKDIENNIISSFEYLDNNLDGWLIHSENYQALNTILPKFKDQVQTIYIDPPYNTGEDEFIYKDRFQNASWLTMLENRLTISTKLMSDEGTSFISIGDTIKSTARIHSESRLGVLCDEIFGENNFVANFVRKSGTAPRQDIKHIANYHDYILCYAKNIDKAKINRKIADISRLRQEDEYLGERGKFDLNQLDRGSKQYSKSLDYSVKIPKETPIIVLEGKSFNKIQAPEDIEIWPKGDPEDRRWIFTWSKEKVEWGIQNDFIVFRKINGKWKIYYKEYELVDNSNKPRERTNPYDTLILDYQNELGTSEIVNLFGKRLFDYPKPSELIKYLLKIGSDKNSLVFDFFSGSGTTAHAVMKLNKEYGSKRKFILAEIGDYFNTIIIPRLKKIAYSFNWKNGKPQDSNGLGIFFKYYDLEQYEDSLNNIKIKEQQNYDKLKPYLIEYILKYGTSDSDVFINKGMLSDPFNIKMKIVQGGIEQETTIDLIETFNLWYGLNTEKNISIYNVDRRYVFVNGKKDKQGVIIIWRNTKNLDLIAERDFILEKLQKYFNIENESQEYTQVLFNNDSSLDLSVYNIEVKSLDPIFFELQWSGFSAE